MIVTAAKLAANRANALKRTGPRTPAGKRIVALNTLKSTGPRSAVGKRHAARNALRHGLTLAVCTDGGAAADVAALARAIAGKNEDPHVIELAWRIASAQIDVMRVRRARRDLLAQPDRLQTARLAALDRYEWRARTRRKYAIREFDEVAWAPRGPLPADYWSEQTKATQPSARFSQNELNPNVTERTKAKADKTN
jgi:hypothetical protein